jgi:hypothetical protein
MARSSKQGVDDCRHSAFARTTRILPKNSPDLVRGDSRSTVQKIGDIPGEGVDVRVFAELDGFKPLTGSAKRPPNLRR